MYLVARCRDVLCRVVDSCMAITIRVPAICWPKLDFQSWKWLSSHCKSSLTEGSERLVKRVRPVSLEWDLKGDKGIDEVILPLG